MKLFAPLFVAAALALPLTCLHASDKAPAAKAPDVAKGEASFAPCAACHGADGNSGSPANPKLAGQHADYLLVALKSYKTENNAKVGRGNAIMGGVAKQFSNAELKELANYVGSLPGTLKTVPQSRFR
jgi:cytochrome c553